MHRDVNAKIYNDEDASSDVSLGAQYPYCFCEDTLGITNFCLFRILFKINYALSIGPFKYTKEVIFVGNSCTSMVVDLSSGVNWDLFNWDYNV